MEEYLTDGDGGYSIQINSLIQANTRQAYHISGGGITPGTSSTNVTAAVSNGEVSVNGTNVTFAAEELTLEDGGIGPSGSDTGYPRVDCISARQDGTLDVTTGDPEPFAPDTDANGNPITPAPFEHWSPSPDSGSRVAGCLLGYVLVGPNATTASDITADEIRQWKIPAGVESGAYVLGNGAENGPTSISVTDAPFAVQDENDTTPAYIKRDPSAPGAPLFLGTSDAPATLRSELRTNTERIAYDSSAENLKIGDRNSNTATPTAIELSDTRAFIRRDTSLEGNPLRDVDKITFSSPAPALDFKPTDAAIEIWESDDATTGDVITAKTDPGRDNAFHLQKNGSNIFKVDTDGATELNESSLTKVANIQFSRSGLSHTTQLRVKDDGTLTWIVDGTGYDVAGPSAP